MNDKTHTHRRDFLQHSLYGAAGLAIASTTDVVVGADTQEASTADGNVTNKVDVPVLLENDANCFALSEATDGAGEGHAVVFGVILGTGVGGGIVVDGKLLSGPNRIAGEWGHNPLPWPRDDERPGPRCYCGKDGCIETFLSGPALTSDHARHNGIELEAEEIAGGAKRGEACSVASMERYEQRLARALANVINVLDPDAIVLGGGMSNIARWYDSVPRLWTEWVFSDRVDTPLLRHRHGDSSGVRGAAWLGI